MNALRISSARLASRQACRSMFMAGRSLSSSPSSPKQLIINAVGTDRLGIVSDMTKYVTDAGGNVGDSQAAKLGSHFSLMMLVQVPGDQIEGLKEQLSSMTDMNASVYEADVGEGTSYDASAAATPKIGYSGKFTVEGADHPGIVHRVTTILSRNGLSIDKMETSDEIAPYGGTTLFRMRGIANAQEPLAAGFDVSKVKSELRQLGDDMNCDVEMVDVEPEEQQKSFYA